MINKICIEFQGVRTKEKGYWISVKQQNNNIVLSKEQAICLVEQIYQREKQELSK